MQLVVVKTKIEAREEFAKNLNAELDRLQAPKRGRPDWLRKQIGEIVSRETCRKWLGGLDLPDQGNMSVLIDTLGLNQQLLRTGRWEPAPGSTDQQFAELERMWPHLDTGLREAVMAVIRTVKAPAQEKRQPGRRRRA